MKKSKQAARIHLYLGCLEETMDNVKKKVFLDKTNRGLIVLKAFNDTSIASRDIGHESYIRFLETSEQFTAFFHNNICSNCIVVIDLDVKGMMEGEALAKIKLLVDTIELLDNTLHIVCKSLSNKKIAFLSESVERLTVCSTYATKAERI